MKFFHGDFTPQGFKRYSGLWKGPPPGNIGKKEPRPSYETGGKSGGGNRPVCAPCARGLTWLVGFVRTDL